MGGTNIHEDEIDVKIGSKDQAFWMDVAAKTRMEIEGLNRMLKFNNAILEMAVAKEKEAEGEFSKKILKEENKEKDI